MQKATIDTEKLLEHREFLLRLARSLSRDESTAEDLVQETWLAALRRPPRHDRRLNAWLGRIVQRLASNRSRDARSREQRERRGARSEVLDPDQDLDGTLELQRDIVDTLRELREPYRRALYLRFYRNLAPREIAAREGLPLPTVKSHLQRGLVELRESLDRRHGGQRALWATPLAGLLETGTETLAVASSAAGWMGGMFALQKLVLAAVVVALAGGVWFVASRDGVETGVEGGGVSDGELSGIDPPTVEVAMTAPAAAPETARSEVELAGTAASSSAASPAVVTGCLVFENGAPAPGIEVTMHRELQYDPENPDRSRRLDPPVPALTNLEGTFEFRMPLAEPIGLSLEARLAGHVPVLWTDRAVESAGRLSLGEKALAPAGSLFAQVRDPEGGTVAGSWSFSVKPLDREDPDWAHRSVRAEPDPTEDSARYVGLPSGRARVTARCGLADPSWSMGFSRLVEVHPGEEIVVLFTYEGPALERRIVVREEIEPRVINTWIPQGAWRLEREGDAPRFPEDLQSTGRVFEDLPPGSYTLEFLDPRFEPWRREGIEPGTVVKARLRGRSAIQLEVLGTEGEVLHDYSLNLLGSNERGPGHQVSLRKSGEKEPEGGIYRGLLPTELDVTIPETVVSHQAHVTSWTIEVEAVGYSPRTVVLDHVPPDEVIPLTVRLDQGATIAGRVRSAEGGVPASEVQILLTPGPLPAAFGMGKIGSSNWQGKSVPPPKAGTTADEEGRFSFESVGEGEWTLRAVQGPWLIADQTLRVATGESAEVELVMPPTGSLVVHFDVPAGADLTKTKLGLSAAASTTRVGWHGDWSKHDAAMVRGGGCTFEALPAGQYSLSLNIFREMCNQGGGYGGIGLYETVHLSSGERREMTWDLRGRFPAHLGLRATVDGRPCHDVRTAPHPLGDPAQPGATRDGNFSPLTSDTGEDCPLPVSPGAYGIDVYAFDGRWGYTVPEEVRLQPAETRIVELELRLQEGTVQLVDDETGDPLADRSVEWFLGAIDFHISKITRRLATDPEGRLELDFPETELGLQLEGYEPVRVRWPGDRERVLRVKAAE